METFLVALFLVAGAAIGSFLNVCIDRLPAGQSIISPPSHCDSCGRRLSVIELVPVVSYLLQRGRCRGCGARIGSRQLWVELICAVLLAVIFWRYGLTAQFGVTAFYSLLFTAVAFIDLEHKLILNKITYPAFLFTLALLCAASIFPSAELFGELRYFPEPRVLSGVIGGGAGFSFFLVVYLISPRGLGLGDVKLAALIGLVTGFPLVLLALFIGIFAGGMAAIVLLLLRRKGRKDEIPYGTFLALGPVITLLWGNQLAAWYLGLFW